MLPLDDTRWPGLHGGYRQPYDARPLIARLASGSDDKAGWGEVWDELHHQGDIGEASYAALPHFVAAFRDRSRDFNLYAYAAMLEECRAAGSNPQVPDWLEAGYHAAQDELLGFAFADLKNGAGSAKLLAMLSFLACYAGAPGHSAILSRIDLWDEAHTTLGEYGESFDD